MVEEVHQSIKGENSTFVPFDQELAVDSQRKVFERVTVSDINPTKIHHSQWIVKE